MNAAIKKGHSPLAIAQHVIDHCARTGINNSLTPMQVLKLVYLAHGWMLGIHGRPLINQDVEAWTYGPVVPTLYHALKVFGSRVVDCVPGVRVEQLDGQEESIVGQVCKVYGERSGVELSTLTHQAHSPWDVTWRKYGKSAVIPNDVIEEHYRSLAQQRVH